MCVSHNIKCKCGLTCNWVLSDYNDERHLSNVTLGLGSSSSLTDSLFLSYPGCWCQEDLPGGSRPHTPWQDCCPSPSLAPASCGWNKDGRNPPHMIDSDASFQPPWTPFDIHDRPEGKEGGGYSDGRYHTDRHKSMKTKNLTTYNCYSYSSALCCVSKC